MKKNEIKALIKQFNLNSEIKWKVPENTKNLVVIENDYCGGVRFEIRVEKTEDGELYVDVRDPESWQPNVACYLIGTGKFWFDYETVEDAIKPAVIAIVKHFYYYY